MSSIQTRLMIVAGLAACAAASPTVGASDSPASGVSTKPAADVSVSLCDGETVMSVPGLKEGEVLPPLRAREVAGEMLQAWRRTQGEAKWEAWSRNVPVQGGSTGTPAQAPVAAAGPAQPTKFTARDLRLWQMEEKKFIDEGYKNFHSAKALGGTIGISCDMCHPDGSNTHPETYPSSRARRRRWPCFAT
jgi:thiosulfate dehydrogenase